MPRDTKSNTFYVNNYIDENQFNKLYNPKQKIKRTSTANSIVQKLIPVLRKAMKQRQKARRAKILWMIKIFRKIDNSSVD